MKTNNKYKLAMLCAITCLFSLFPVLSQAQTVSCPYVITNNLNCRVTIKWELLYDSGCSSPSPCNGNNGTINPGGSITVSCADFSSGTCPGGNMCNIWVTITHLDGTLISPYVTADINNTNPSVPQYNFCNGISSNMAWTTSGCIINP